MAVIKTNGTYVALPSGIKRGNPIPLDTSAVWYDKAQMEAYAQSGATAYVGQILSLVNTDSGKATAYIIMDAAGTLQEVGAATLGDNNTIVLNSDNTLSLKNWGVQYYKWVDGENGNSGSHVLQVVDETHPWIAGLEPKVSTTTEGELEIAWYEPSTITVEGVNSAITSLQTTVAAMSAGIGSADDASTENTIHGEINGLKESKLDLAGGTMTGDIILPGNSKAASEAVVDTKIASAIGSAGHLKREIVTTLPAVENANPDTIYMIKKEGAESYLEYILITVDGVSKLEQIGDTTVDLTNYLQKVPGAVINDFAAFNSDGALVDSGVKATDFVRSNDFEEYKNATEGVLNKKVNNDDETYSSLANNATKLEGLLNIKSVGQGLTLNAETGELSNSQEEGIKGVLLGAAENEATIDENKKVMVPVAGALLGLVKTSTEDNGVSISADGTMSINRVSATKLYVDEGDELIFNCGKA